MQFECPQDWASATVGGKLVGVIEVAKCKYVYIIETVLVCAHPLMMPKAVGTKQRTIDCQLLRE